VESHKFLNCEVGLFRFLDPEHAQVRRTGFSADGVLTDYGPTVLSRVDGSWLGSSRQDIGSESGRSSIEKKENSPYFKPFKITAEREQSLVLTETLQMYTTDAESILSRKARD
jgi:hypothetical protein